MNIQSLTTQASDERSFMGNSSLTPGAVGGFHHGRYPNNSNAQPLPVPSHRSISPGSSFGGGSISSAVSEVPPLLPLHPLHKPRDPTMPWNPEQAAAARQKMRPFDSSRAAYSEGVPQRSTGWSIGSPHPLSQSHNESRFGGQRFDPTREASRSPTSDPLGKKQKTEGLLSEGLRKESYLSHSQPRDNYDDQMLRKIATGKLTRDGSNLSSTSIGSPRSALSAGLASFQDRVPKNGLPIPFSSSPSNPLQPWQGDRSNPERTAMAFRPTEFPPVFPAPITGAPPRHHHAPRPFEHDRMSIGGDQDFGYDEQPRRNSRSRSSQGYDDTDDLQMDGFPPSHVSNRMEGLSLENPTPPRTPSSISGQRQQQQQQQRGSKRRASSPDSGSNNRRSPVGGYTPRLSPNASIRSQPPSTFSLVQNRGPGSSISTSISSTNTGWSSYQSTVPSAASSMHNDRALPIHSLPLSQTPQDQAFESKSITPNQRSMVIREREREIQPAKPENSELVAPRPPGRFNGFSYICDCCPKKPKKFETQAELEQHESEKQHKCQYCDNKFKNKNEAERHQNSLHLRKHSWSCAALTSPEAAFHPSKTDPKDICGYCGQEFPVPANWEVRMLHLTSDHKFGECNQAKKFFRADHFRQHLKHSHSGTSGKWTNVLETACMRDEGRMDQSTMNVPLDM